MKMAKKTLIASLILGFNLSIACDSYISVREGKLVHNASGDPVDCGEITKAMIDKMKSDFCKISSEQNAEFKKACKRFKGN